MGNVSRAKRNIAWIEAHCRVPEGKDVGKPIRVRPWQKRILVRIYDNKIPTRYAIVSFAKKNGKTALAAMLLLLHLVGPEAKQNSQLYSGAQSRDQAAVAFALAAKMVRMSPALRDVLIVRDSAKELACPELGTVYKALSAEATTAHGKSPIFVIHDELGQVVGPRSALYDALETADGAHEEPLSVIISTQAASDADLLSILIDDAIANNPPDTVLCLFTADESLDPFGIEAMRQANPALGDFLSLESLRKKAERAQRMPASEATYRNFNLNQRISQSNPLIPRMIWQACSGEPSREVLLSSKVFAGLDLSARNDLTALAYGAQDENGVWHVWVEFFAPSKGIVARAQRDRVPYDVWADSGYITLTPGATVDYDFVAARLASLCRDYDVETVAFDRWRYDVLLKDLGRYLEILPSDEFEKEVLKQIPLSRFGQGFKDMAPAVDSMEAALNNEKIRHGGNPVLTWCAANTIATRDPADNRKLDKAKSTGRIDGIVALAMMLGASGMRVEQKDGPSVYETRGLEGI